jgi:ABC-type lipoprotein release transport system permease subunit
MKLVLCESVILGGLGTILGLLAGSAMIAWYGRQGLELPLGEAFSYFLPFPSTIYLRYSWDVHLRAVIAVLATSVIAAIGPSLRACRLRPAEALRHV